MKYCNNCLEPNTRVGIKFSANGNCPTCEYYSHFINNYDENNIDYKQIILDSFKYIDNENKIYHIEKEQIKDFQ